MPSLICEIAFAHSSPNGLLPLLRNSASVRSFENSKLLTLGGLLSSRLFFTKKIESVWRYYITVEFLIFNYIVDDMGNLYFTFIENYFHKSPRFFNIILEFHVIYLDNKFLSRFFSNKDLTSFSRKFLCSVPFLANFPQSFCFLCKIYRSSCNGRAQ